MAIANLNTMKLCSWNVRGLQKPAKRRAVLSFLKQQGVSIAFLQESHLEDKDNVKLKRGWVGHVFATSFSSYNRGVVILINKNLAFRSLSCITDTQGRYVIVKGVLSGKNITLMNLYCPPGFSPDFLSKAFSIFADMEADHSFVAGDFNCHLEPARDKLPPGTGQASKQARMLSSICQDMGYADVWRTLHPTDLEFTFFSNPHKCHTRIDYLFIPSSNMFLALSCTIGSIVLSDHAPVYMVYSLSEERAFSKRWRLQTSILKDDHFISYFTSEFRIFYSINSSSTDNSSTLWETCKSYSRGLIMSYMASKKRKQSEQRILLESKLANLEKSYIQAQALSY